MTDFIRDLRKLRLDDAAALLSLFLGGALVTVILAIIKHGGAQ